MNRDCFGNFWGDFNCHFDTVEINVKFWGFDILGMFI